MKKGNLVCRFHLKMVDYFETIRFYSKHALIYKIGMTALKIEIKHIVSLLLYPLLTKYLLQLQINATLLYYIL